MAIRVREKHITLSVRDLLHTASRQQTISSFPLPQRGMLGRQAQVKVQQHKDRSFGLFHKEYSVQREYQYQDYTFTVQGRIDGLYRLKNRAEIEEIKSVVLRSAEFKNLQIEHYPEFKEQVLFYAYLLQDELDGLEVFPYLILVNLINDAKRTFQIDFKRTIVEQLLQQRFASIIQNIEKEEAELEERRKKLTEISFGLSEKRPQQQQMMEQVTDVLQNSFHLMASAPTGTGKTAAALFPAIQYSFVNSKKIFFVTSKTTQQNIVFETVGPLIEQGLGLHVLFLRASEKMCANDVYFCHEAFCPYIQNYQERCLDRNVLSELLENSMLTPEIIYAKGSAYTLCPFELSLDLSQFCDVLVGDYNYVFDPAVYLRRLFSRKDYADWVLIIDEAHNLYDRGMGYLSPEIRFERVKNLLVQTGKYKTKVYQLLNKALHEMEQLFTDLNLEGRTQYSGQQYFLAEINAAAWQSALEVYEAAFIKYLIHKVKKRILLIDDPLEKFFYELRRFVQVARIQDRAFVPFYNAEDNGILKIQCCDPSHYLGGRIDGFHSVLAMSATLDPISFYQEVLGFQEYRTNTMELDSPFPAEHRKIIIVPNISTRFKDRVQNAPAIAEIIRNTIKIHSGNYLAFFPSFNFLQQVNLFLGNLQSEKIIQKPGMKDEDRRQVLDELEKSDNPHLLLAVMGGIFSEGVDYAGNMAEGVIIISPALPQINYERELLRNYYDEQKEMGFDYAYIYPGMNKVIQSVGRLIRSAADKGIVLLIGERFSDDQYNSVLPEYWFESAGDVVIADDYEQEVKSFWAKWER